MERIRNLIVRNYPYLEEVDFVAAPVPGSSREFRVYVTDPHINIRPFTADLEDEV